MNCPICNTKLTLEILHYDKDGNTERSKYKCNYCYLYNKTFFDGSTKIIIGDFDTGYSDIWSSEKKNEIMQKVKEIAKLYKNEIK
jgi:hypothetical protein